jgi:pyruvate dehydrogenase E1 component alpha subunit
MLGSNLPVASGLGLSFKMEQSDNVVLAYFGEGASNTGDFHEGLNMAGVLQLPVVFICENNFYAYSVPFERAMAIEDVAQRAESYGFDGVAVNGNDVLAVYQATQGAIQRSRSGAGPTLIECKTYRWHGHSEHDKAFYRTDEEIAMWRSRDPIPTFTTFLQDRKVLTPEKLEEIETRVKEVVDDAALEAVDLVAVFDEDTPEKLIERVQPTVLVKGADYTREQVVGREIVEARGGEIVLIDLVPGHSTTAMVERRRVPKVRRQ